MICVIHQHGTSFAGLGAYVLHDPDHAQTSDRVAWTHTHNLATDDPELATRIMAATAMDGEALKQASENVPNTGRKLKKSVMHYSLSWHEEEREELSREAMIEAALASMSYLGTSEGERLGKHKSGPNKGKEIYATRTQFADEHQAVIVCHDEGDGSHPHVHIMLNRVHPEHGVALPANNEREKLSAWALDYRKAQGKEDYCPERIKSAALREAGFRTENKRDPRNVYEQKKKELELIKNQEKGSSSSGDGQTAAILHENRKKAAQKHEEHMEKMAKLKERVRAAEDAVLEVEKRERDKAAQAIREARKLSQNQHKENLSDLVDQQQTEQERFDKGERSALGRIRNTLEILRSGEWKDRDTTTRLHAVKQAWELAGDRAKRELEKQGQFEAEKERFKEDRKLTLSEQRDRMRQEAQTRIQEQLALFEGQRNDLRLERDMEKAKIRSEWKSFREKREKELLAASMSKPVEKPDKKAEKKEPPGDLDIKPENLSAPDPPEDPFNAQTDAVTEPLKPTFDAAASPEVDFFSDESDGIGFDVKEDFSKEADRDPDVDLDR